VSVRSPSPSRYRAVLFDLDGTLVETRQDIATGVNGMLAERGLDPLAVEQVGRHVGRGARVLVTCCLAERGITVRTDEEIGAAYESFHRTYSAHLLDTTRPYPDVQEMCGRLERAGIAMAIVSNKPEDLSRRVLEGVGLAQFFPVVLGGDSLPVRKPDPAPLFRALSLLGIEDAALMVGDSEIDIQAARAAGMAVAAVAWGFGSQEELRASGADRLFDCALELTDWILG
jgi:phosphoglycolate phosphatase